MSIRAKKLEQDYLQTILIMSRTTRDKKEKIGSRALASFIRSLVDECSSMNLKTSVELFKIAEEMEGLY